MLVDRITALFGASSDSSGVLELFQELNTYNRPELSPEGSPYFDWVLVRRSGLELGFAESQYFNGENRSTWGTGPLLLVQCYLYSGHDDIKQYKGELPCGLHWGESRNSVRRKLDEFEATRRSSASDCWDINGLRMTASFTENHQSLERLFLRAMTVPLPPALSIGGLTIVSKNIGLVGGPLEALLAHLSIDQEELDLALEDGDLDLRYAIGLSAHCVQDAGQTLIRSIVFHRDRDMDACQWPGPLPNNLVFDDSPELMFEKLQAPPADQSSSSLTGSATWHFDEYTLHVLYSKVDNRLVRISVHAPGVWKSVRN